MNSAKKKMKKCGFSVLLISILLLPLIMLNGCNYVRSIPSSDPKIPNVAKWEDEDDMFKYA